MINFSLLINEYSILFIILIMIIGLFDAILKIIAAWSAAKDKKKIWFVFLIISNTAGILPIIYLLLRKKSKKRKR